MSNLILILGGARGGKSTFAENLARQSDPQSVLYVATAEPMDDEMRDRIAVHRADRPVGWMTLEAPRQLSQRIPAALTGRSVVLIDCMTILVSNMLLDQGDGVAARVVEAAVMVEIDALLALVRQTDATWILVSNEVGLGLVPPYPLGRLYRDVLGRVNQRLAADADRVVFVAAGLPLELKPQQQHKKSETIETLDIPRYQLTER